MSQKYTGKVFKIYDKVWGGNKPTTYSIKLDGQPLYHRTGTNRYAGIAESGKVVEFFATPNADDKSANVDGPVTEVTASAPAASGTPSYGGGWNDPGRQNSIVYQSSRKDAIEFVTFLYEKEVIPMPKTPKDRLGNVEATLDRITAQFFNDVNTLGAVVREAESEGTPEAATAEGDSGE
jgi:hypothetical protein